MAIISDRAERSLRAIQELIVMLERLQERPQDVLKLEWRMENDLYELAQDQNHPRAHREFDYQTTNYEITMTVLKEKP